MDDFPNRIEISGDLSKALRKKLKRAGIPTFKRLARFKRFTLITRVAGLTPKYMLDLVEALKQRGLTFSHDPVDIIIPREGIGTSRILLARLWAKRIYCYRDLSKFNYWDIIALLGGERSLVFECKGTIPWMKEHGITPSNNYRFFDVGFSVKTRDVLMSQGVRKFKEISNLSDEQLALILTGHTKRPGGQEKWSGITLQRIREIKYVLWKNGYTVKCRPL